MAARGNGNYGRIKGKYGAADTVYAIMGAGDRGEKIPVAVSRP